jgi:hypothetical protein
MFHSSADLARFLRLHPAAITRANHRYDCRLRQNPNLDDDLIALIMAKS